MDQQPTEIELVQWARAGDKAAFAQLIDRSETMIYRLAGRMVGDPETARDVAQEAILQSYLSLERLRDEAQFQSWLYGIVLNLCRSYRRSKKPNVLSLEALAGGLHFDALPFTDPGPDPHTLAEMREVHEQVLAAVAALSPKNREATLLFYYEGLSVQEIAAGLNISVTAVKGRLHKARRQLRELLLPAYAPAKQTTSLPERKRKMVQVTIADVVTTPENDHKVIVLLDEAGKRLLPIWIGSFEAEAIALQLLKRTTPRPLTYDFIAKLLEAAAVQLEEVRIEALQGNTFYAIAKLRSGGSVAEVDARPSDAVALALRMACPIYVSEEVMARAGETIPAHYQAAALGQGLKSLDLQILTKLQEAAQAAAEQPQRSEAEREESRQKLLAHLFEPTQV
ncbi:MAG: DUF151 domain-containing protein [Caldilineaceae bacterium]